MGDEEKKTRRYKKAALTRLVNKTDTFIVTKDLAGLQTHIEAMKDAYEDFNSAHERYHNLLEDENEIDVSDEYFFSEQRKYVDAMRKATEYVEKNVPPAAKPPAEDEVKPAVEELASQDLVRLMNLPKIELERFDGDPLMYPAFSAMVKETIDPLTCDEKIKLTRLMQYTGDKARNAIRPCMMLEGGTAYEEAKKILKQRFGDQHLVMERIVRNLRSNAPAKSPDEIQALSDEMTSAHATLTQMGKLAEIDCQTLIVEIIQRFPFFIQKNWKSHALDMKRTKEKYPDFGSLVEFIKRKSEDMNDPVYGNLKHKSHVNFKKTTSSSSLSFSTDVSRPSSQYRKPPCLLCSSDHRLMYCPAFKKLKPKERLNYVKENRLCENCLLNNHSTNNCRKQTVCDVSGCGKKHTRLIHIENESVKLPHLHENVKVSNASATNDHVYMPVTAVSVNGRQVTSVLLDNASSSTFCTRELAKSLGLKGHGTTLVLNTLNATDSKESRLVNFTVASLNGPESLDLRNVYVVDRIPVTVPVADTKSFKHLEGLNFTGFGREVHVLIGQDNSEALVPLETRTGVKGEPFAVRTLLGWPLNGPGNSSQKVKGSVISHFVDAKFDQNLECKVEALWSVENEGLVNDDCSWSQDDSKVIALWDAECRLVDNHYQIPIPWKANVNVPNNFGMAVSRLNSTRSSLLKRGLLSKYDAEMNKLFTSGYAEQIPVDQIDSPGDKVWYLPHQPVLNDKKPDKLRIVFDCAAKWQGESLNDKCLQGPDLNNKLLYVLLRFRQHEYAILADIEAMYYQVLIPQEDRNALRFLWVDSNDRIVQYRMTRHVFGGIWCSASSTYALRRVLNDFNDVDSLVADTRPILRSFYVDDCLRSVPRKEDANVVIQGTRNLLQKGGFRLTKFVASDEKLIKLVSESDRAKVIGQTESSKALGTKWNVDDDVFSFDVDVDLNSVVTRRKILSVVSSVFDPLGLLSPVIITGKIILQDATRLKIPWDERTPEDVQRRWLAWLKSIGGLDCVRIARCVKPTSFDDACIQLHHYSDSSLRAYGSCTYVRCVNKVGEIHTALVMSKAKVAPLKPMTIPRLELQAAVLSAQIDDMLRRELDLHIAQSFFWVDSELVLKYIRNETRRFHVFVGNRVSIIRNLSEPSQWNFIPGVDNPADLLTRGKDPESINSEKWQCGPAYLKTYMSEWKIPACGDLNADDPEVKRDVSIQTSCATSVLDHPLDMMIKKYSSWYELKRAVAWFLRLRSKLMSSPHKKGLLSVEEISKAELMILKHVQGQYYQQEKEDLSKEKIVGKSSALKSLDPVLDVDGLIRVGGRLKHASVEDCCKRPYILPHGSPIARLIALEKHEISHSGVEWVVSLIRRKFWITKVRIVVKGISSNCFKCKKLFSMPCVQKMADLPLERVSAYKPPFSSTGVDCFGPILVKQGRSDVKRYGCIFTCMATRAVHIEKLNGLDTDTFINAFRRFLARRGCVETVLSDQGTNFTGASSELAKSLRQLNNDRISQLSVKLGVQWTFNPPGASHIGGVWERLIRTVRKVMAGVLRTQTRLNDDGLETLFCEIEAILNSRPLTKVSDDVHDASSLTPNHLLLLRDCPSLPPGFFVEADLYRRRWRCVQHLADEFWKRWLREYLPELQRRRKWLQVNRNISVGDLVLITQENTPRGLWPIGLVVKVSESKDGLVRSAEIQTKSTKLVRPVTKLVLLEGAN